MTTIRLGDTVRGEYHGVAFEGIVDGYDGSGYIYVTPSAPIVVYDLPRKGICFSPHDRHELTVVKLGPALTADDIYYAPPSCLGGASLRKKG